MKFLLPIFLFLGIFGGLSDDGPNENFDKEMTQLEPDSVEAIIAEHFVQSFSFGAAGDVLIHDHLYEDVKTEDGYDFVSRVEEVSPYLQKQDLVFLNQETPIGGEALGLSGYPNFNSPIEAADLLEAFGTDIVSNANNHTLDKKEAGILRTIDVFEERGIEYVGANKSAADAERDRILEVNGIKVGFVGYTYGTNGMPIPEGKDYLVNLIDSSPVYEDIEALDKKVDLLVVSMHQGVEYEEYPREEHRQQALEMTERGADVVLGHHPHVLQPIEINETEDGREAVIAHSLGNFFSAQQSLETKLGGIIGFDVKKQAGETSVDNVRFMPTYVSSQEYDNFQLVPLADAENYGLEDADLVYEDVSTHMTEYSDQVEIMEYLE
ncbi:CapA family protein [Salinicoccus sp. HZC-1]|uniref:CapA family protein n=1 Tax=Salinicoccus sp. HZC-1 TaxID=3385497 RepID=UPI00398B3229